MRSSILYAVPIGIALGTLTTENAAAQEHCKMSGEAPAADSKYTQQLAIDVGDIPGHQVRVFELHRVFSNAKPNCEGLKNVEEWARGYSDYVNRNGRGWGYGVTTLESGDKIYSEWAGTAQTVVAPDGSKKSTFHATSRWTGGTGKYQGVRGVGRSQDVFDPEKGLNQSTFEAEYWFEK